MNDMASNAQAAVPSTPTDPTPESASTSSAEMETQPMIPLVEPTTGSSGRTLAEALASSATDAAAELAAAHETDSPIGGSVLDVQNAKADPTLDTSEVPPSLRTEDFSRAEQKLRTFIAANGNLDTATALWKWMYPTD